MLVSFLPHSVNTKFLTMAQVFYCPTTSLSPTTLPLLGFSKRSSASEPLPLQILLPETPIPDNCRVSSLTSFQFLLKGQFLSQRPSPYPPLCFNFAFTAPTHPLPGECKYHCQAHLVSFSFMPSV